MKVLFNPAVNGLCYSVTNRQQQNNEKPIKNLYKGRKYECTVPQYIPNLVFKSACPANILIEQSENLICALTGKPLIPPLKIDSICKGFPKMKSISGEIYRLKSYKDYFPEIEKQISELFQNYIYANKRDFQEILKIHAPNSLKILKEKEINILSEKDDVISNLDKNLSEQIKEIRDIAIESINNETFNRKDFLEQIRILSSSNSSNDELKELYKYWHQSLPSSTNDYDAFIVEYSKQPHAEIIRRLFNSSMAVLKPIREFSQGGQRELGNYLLVSKNAARESGGISIEEYLDLNPVAANNIKKYIDFIRKSNVKNKQMIIIKKKYLKEMQINLEKETNSKLCAGANRQVKTTDNPLMAQAKYLICAFSGKPMLQPIKLKEINKNLSKTTNAQEALKILQQYKNYMQDIERQIFDMIKDSKDKETRNFQDILQEHYSESLQKLKDKEISILNGRDIIISGMNGNLSQAVTEIRDNAIAKVNDGTFVRNDVLKQLKNLNVFGEDKVKLDKIYDYWLNLPISYNDCDAFIVKYAHHPHSEIAQRLLSLSVAYLKPINTVADKNNTVLGNYLLVSKYFAIDSRGMSFEEYLERKPYLRNNIQKYINNILDGGAKGKPLYISRKTYTRELYENISEATHNSFCPIVGEVKMAHPKISSAKGCTNRYRNNHFK